MPKAAQGSAKSPTAGGSARTKNPRRGARPDSTGADAREPAGGSASAGAAKTGTKEAEKEPLKERAAEAERARDGEDGTAREKNTGSTDAQAGTTAKAGKAAQAGEAVRDGKSAEAPARTTAVTAAAAITANTATTANAAARSGGSPKTSALTRTVPLRQNPAVAEGTTAGTSPRPRAESRTEPRTGAGTKPPARARTRPRPPEPRVSVTARLGRRIRAGMRRVPGWWPLPLCLLLGAGAGATYSAVTPPQYAATSYVVVSPAAGQSEAAGALGYAQAYGKIATDPVILADAEKRARLRSGSIRDHVQANTSPDAPMVQITATSTSAPQAAETADAVAKALSHTAKNSTKRTGARLTVLSEAMAPPAPVSPSAGVAVAVGACAGGLLGGLVLLVRQPSRRRRAVAEGDSAAAQGVHVPYETAGGEAGTEQAR